MDGNKSFSMREIVGIGLISGITVSLVKLIQWNFRLDDVTWISGGAALVTVLAYMALGAIGAVFLVDHDARGQKMMKNAFLMGFVAPSFFLALLNNPAVIRPDAQRAIDRVPKISNLFIGSAYADEPRQISKIPSDFKGVRVLERKEVEPKFGVAVKNAFGWGTAPSTYTFVVGTTDNVQKAASTADNVNRMLITSPGGKNLKAIVVQPKGKTDYYVTVGALGTADHAYQNADAAKEAALKQLPETTSEERKRAAALVLGGQVVDARAMFLE